MGLQFEFDKDYNLQFYQKRCFDKVFKGELRENELYEHYLNHPKVLVIGNSPKVLKYKIGKYIDEHFDIVIRINKHPIKGYEKFIGSKTDIWATTFNTPRPKKDWYDGVYIPENYEKIKQIWASSPNTRVGGIDKEFLFEKKNNHELWCMWDKKFKLDKRSVRIFRMFEEYSQLYLFNKYIEEHNIDSGKDKRFIRDHCLKKFQPCTGLKAILNGLVFFKDITIHGFDFYMEDDKINNSKYGWYYQVKGDASKWEEKHWEERNNGDGEWDEVISSSSKEMNFPGWYHPLRNESKNNLINILNKQKYLKILKPELILINNKLINKN